MSRLCLCLRLRGWCEPSLRALNGKKPLSKAHMNMHTCASMEEGGWLGRGRFRSCGPVARIFCGGCVPQESGPNILMFEWYAMQVPKTHRAEWRTYGVIEIGTSFHATGNTCERRRRKPLGGSGGMPPRNFSSLKALKCHFQRSQTENCVKKVPKIDRCHKIWHIFIIKNYYHTSFNARKIRY